MPRATYRAALVAALASACADAGPKVLEDTPVAQEADVVRAVSLRRVTDLGPLETASVIRGRDGGYSGVFAGRSVWLYGDTVLSEPDAAGGRWHHNSWSFTVDLEASDGIGAFRERADAAGAPVELFALTPEEAKFNAAHFATPCQAEPCGARWAMWPGPLVADDERERALVFYNLIYAEVGDFNFASVGSSIAVWRDFAALPERWPLTPGAEHPTLLFHAGEPPFGAAALAVGSLLYVFACELDFVTKPCLLARVPLARATERAQWRYWAGSRYVPELAAAVPVFDGNDIMSVQYSGHHGQFLAVYSRPLTREVVLRSSADLEGPWSDELLLFTALPTANEQADWVYDGLAHSELARDGGRVQVVSYSRTTGLLQSELRLVEVELE